jgi:transcription elongation factor Elf1
MKPENFETGASATMHCSACGVETSHTVQAVTKTGKLTSAICDTCQTSSKYKGGVKTGVTAGTGKAPDAYDRKKKYRKGQAMMHPVFGHGEVTVVTESQKIDVLFGDTTRRLIHDQGE